MPCMICGEPGLPTGDGHLCRRHGGAVAEPSPPPVTTALVPQSQAPAWWNALTWALIVAAAGYIALIGVRIWALAHEDTIVDEMRADPRAVDLADVQRFIDEVRSLDQAYAVLLFVYVAIFLVWLLTLGKLLTRLGHDRRAVTRHWTFVAWRVMLLPIILLAVLLRNGPLPDTSDPQLFHDAVIAANHHQMLYSAARLVMLGLLIAATVTVWNRVRAGAAKTV